MSFDQVCLEKSFLYKGAVFVLSSSVSCFRGFIENLLLLLAVSKVGAEVNSCIQHLFLF